MRLSSLLKSVAVAAVAVSTVAAVSNADARVRMKIHSAFSKNIVIIGPGPHNVADAIEKMSDGEVQMKVFEPGALVPGTQYYDPVSTGSIDGAWGTPGYNVNKNFAYAFFSAVPFGPRGGEYMAWMRHGGGQQLADEMYARDNIKMFVCNLIPPESSGWFRKEIKSLDDLKGLKMRFFGLGAKVMEKFGVSTQLLAGGDIYPALELGSIDATEFSMPAIDKDYGFYQIAKHNYFPGWHQPATLGEMIFNMDKFNELSDGQKVMVDQACQAQTLRGFAEGEAIQGAAMKFFETKGVTIHRWPQETLDKFEAAWKEVVVNEIGDNDDAKKIWASFSKFREEYKLWGENGYLK
ncbi:MAG: TRAP transporter substrate-binding protein [Alphaproteobacteria bacterium]|nr:TRAP transporter substrate-binding protein [Alphaproteobacteria bacterium]MCB9946218.1 TRAP transporter substrate-binding protein [Rhodospirillaceae bacterium]